MDPSKNNNARSNDKYSRDVRPQRHKSGDSFSPFVDAISSWRIWLMLAVGDVRVRYRRSKIGPFWVTISMAVTIGALAVVYASIFKIKLSIYVPLVGISYIVWGLISTMINESSTVFIESGHYIQNSSIPFPVYIFRMLTRNLILFLHNLILVPILLIAFGVPTSLKVVLFIPGLCIFLINVAWFSSVVGVLSARYRDLPQIVGAIVQIAFFISPIMWTAKQIPDRFQSLLIWNPFAVFLNLMRSPLLSQNPPLKYWIVGLSMGFIGTLLALLLSTQSKKKLPFYV